MGGKECINDVRKYLKENNGLGDLGTTFGGCTLNIWGRVCRATRVG